MSSLAVTLTARRPLFFAPGRRHLLRRFAAASGRSPAAARTGAAALLAVEIGGSATMWAPIPIACFWLGGRVYDLTGSLSADLGVAFAAFIAATCMAMAGLARVDRAWVTLRRRGGHEQAQGALTRVVIVSATLGLAAFTLWYYVIGQAYVIPFMPTR